MSSIATQMGWDGELNVGQLAREKHGNQAVLVGFTTYDGTVTAANDWGGAAQRMRVNPGMPESVEGLFHEVGLPRFLLPLRGAGEALGELREPMLERAIGVVYRPRTERYSHYFDARVAHKEHHDAGNRDNGSPDGPPQMGDAVHHVGEVVGILGRKEQDQLPERGVGPSLRRRLDMPHFSRRVDNSPRHLGDLGHTC